MQRAHRTTSQERYPSLPKPRSFVSTLGHWALFLVLLAPASVGCAKARAATVPDGPPLAVPVPPPRVFGPVEDAPLATAPIVEETPAVDAPSVPEAAPARRAATPPATDKPSVTASPAPETAAPPRELRAASTPADAEMDRKIRALLALASRNLGQVDYRRLTVAGREQYDQAKGFGDQAQEALSQRNYVFAQTLADKAATLAAELLGRAR